MCVRVCVRVCVGVCVCVCVCVCIRVYVHPQWRLHLAGVGIPGDRSTMWHWRRFFPLSSPFIATCSHTRSGQSHDLTSFMWLSFSKHGAFSYHYQASPLVHVTSVNQSAYCQLDKVLKKICLFWSNVAALVQQALLVDALVETSWLDKPPHRVKAGFIEGDNGW